MSPIRLNVVFFFFEVRIFEYFHMLCLSLSLKTLPCKYSRDLDRFLQRSLSLHQFQHAVGAQGEGKGDLGLLFLQEGRILGVGHKRGDARDVVLAKGGQGAIGELRGVIVVHRNLDRPRRRMLIENCTIELVGGPDKELSQQLKDTMQARRVRGTQEQGQGQGQASQ